ncbi:ankyrin [Hypoxylon sp. FL0543]|nr:ankyrin [Hypoxylon sp. FL0543]
MAHVQIALSYTVPTCTYRYQIGSPGSSIEDYGPSNACDYLQISATMASLDDLPNELLLFIAQFCGYECTHIDGLENAQAHHKFASLARVNRRLHGVFDSILWEFNLRHGVYDEDGLPTASAVYWAASRNRIDILEKALKYKHPLGKSPNGDPMHRAAANGHAATCSWLLDHGVPVDYTPGEQMDIYSQFTDPTRSPLHAAITNGHESTTIFLLERGAKLNFQGRLEYNSAIHLAAYHSLPRVVEYLVKTKRIDVNMLDHQSDMPLHYAVRARHNGKTIQTLIDLGADIDPEHNFKLPLTIALLEGHFSNAMVLLDAGARVNPINAKRDTVSPLIASTANVYDLQSYFNLEENELVLQAEVIRKIIARGADVEGGFNATTPLCSAIEEGTTSAVFELLKAGADVAYLRYDYRMPFDLLWVIIDDVPKEEFICKATLLVAAGWRLDFPRSYLDNKTQLQVAADWCHKRESWPLATFLRLATRQSTRDGGYLDELFGYCLVRQYLKPAKMLIHHGADPKQAHLHALSWALQIIGKETDDESHEALSLCLACLREDDLDILFSEAVSAAKVEICQLLLDHGVTLPLNEFRPWLHQAASSGNFALVRRLHRLGMDVNSLDDEFNTPMMSALRCGEIEVAEALFELGTDPFHPRPDSECRRLPNLSTQILSPFEFAIHENRPLDMRRWWMGSSPGSRPMEEFYIPRVLAKGPWLCGYLKLLRRQYNENSPEYDDEKDLEWIRESDMAKFDEDSERIHNLLRAMEQVSLYDHLLIGP